MHAWFVTALIVAALAASSCASSGVRPQPFPMPPGPGNPAADAPGRPPGADVPLAHPDGFAIASAALRLQGIPYRSGGADPHGFDCSGLVQYVFSRTAGVALPRTSEQMSTVGSTVSMAELRPGDLVFFNTLRRRYSHVGIYVGNQRFIHAPTSGGVVEIVDLRRPYWQTRFDGARRLNI